MAMENLEIYEAEMINDDEIDKEYDLSVDEDGEYDLSVDEDCEYHLCEENGEEDNPVIKNWYSDLMSRSFYPSDGVISPMDRYNIYGQAIRCMKCDSLYHVQKDCHIN